MMPLQATAKWLKQIIKSEQLHEHLTKKTWTKLAKSTVVGRTFRMIKRGDQTSTLEVIGNNKFTLERIRRSTARC